MKNSIYFSLLLVALFCCHPNGTNVTSKGLDPKSNVNNQDDDGEAFQSFLSMDYLLANEIYQLAPSAMDDTIEILRLGTSASQFRVLSFHANNALIELRFYDRVDLEYVGFVAHATVEEHSLNLSLNHHNDPQVHQCELAVSIEDAEYRILSMTLPDDCFRQEDSRGLFISKTELDSIMVPNVDYMNALDDDPRQYVPFYFKLAPSWMDKVHSVTSANGTGLQTDVSLTAETIRIIGHGEPVFVRDTLSSITLDGMDGYWLKAEDMVGDTGLVFSGHLKK